MGHEGTRRQFLREAATMGAAMAAVDAAQAASSGEATPQAMPTIRLGDLEVSRFILGSNPFFGFAHKPDDTGKRMRAYYTQERIMATMDEAADHGITAVWTPCYDHWIRLWDTYRERGGKLKTWIGQPDPKPEQMKAHIKACAEHGGKAICIQGCRIDEQMGKKRYGVVRRWLDLIHELGLPAGIATHRPTTHLVAEDHKLPTDFYHQCVYQPENYSPTCLQQALATIGKLDKPVVAYKVLAAGRIPPQTAFPRLFRRLRPKDGLCVGVFPKDDPDQIAEDVALTCTLSRAKA